MVDSFPVSISGIEFSTTLTDAAITTFDVVFAYTYYNIGVAGRAGGVPGVPDSWIIDGGGGYQPECTIFTTT